MFTDDPRVEQLSEKIWIVRNFFTDEENSLISNTMDKYKIENGENAYLYDKHFLDWYRDKQGPVLEECKQMWNKMSDFLYPEYYMHPQLSLVLQRPEDEGMFVHTDSPGEGNECDLTQTDVWNTCCVISFGVVGYFGDFKGGEIFYPSINKDGSLKDSPPDPYNCLEIDVRAGDLAIHGAQSPWSHGTRKVTEGIRYSYANFAMTREKAPGTFPLYNPEIDLLPMDKDELSSWNRPKPNGTFTTK